MRRTVSQVDYGWQKEPKDDVVRSKIMHGIVHTILDMKRTSHTQRHRYEFFSRRSPTRLIILCLCSVLAGIIFTGLFFLCPIIPSHTGNRDRDSSFYLHVSSKTMMVLRAIPIRYRADMEDHLQLSARSISMVSLIDDAVNLTFDGTMNRGTDAKEEFDWTPMEATALHALKSGDFFPPFISQSTSRRDSTLSNSESRLNYGREDQIISTTTNVLCTTFAPLRRNAFSSIMHKLFANHASSMSSHQMSENQSRKRHQLSSNATAVTCDWLVLFYEGDQTLLSELQEVEKYPYTLRERINFLIPFFLSVFFHVYRISYKKQCLLGPLDGYI